MAPLERLIPPVDDELQSLGFDPLDQFDGAVGGERHGAWDWTWFHSDHGWRTRFVRILADEPSPGLSAVQIWAAASTPSSFGQQLIDVVAQPWDAWDTPAPLINRARAAASAARDLPSEFLQ